MINNKGKLLFIRISVEEEEKAEGKWKERLRRVQEYITKRAE